MRRHRDDHRGGTPAHGVSAAVHIAAMCSMMRSRAFRGNAAVHSMGQREVLPDDCTGIRYGRHPADDARDLRLLPRLVRAGANAMAVLGSTNDATFSFRIVLRTIPDLRRALPPLAIWRLGEKKSGELKCYDKPKNQSNSPDLQIAACKFSPSIADMAWASSGAAPLTLRSPVGFALKHCGLDREGGADGPLHGQKAAVRVRRTAPSAIEPVPS